MTWDDTFIDVCLTMAARSHDPDSKYGCVIVDEECRILATGYNDIPRGLDHNDKYYQRPDKYMYIVHAEQNACYNAAAQGVSIDGATAYVFRPPCIECLKALYQSGVREIVYAAGHPPVNEDVDPTDWRFTLATAKEMAMRLPGLSIRKAVLSGLEHNDAS